MKTDPVVEQVKQKFDERSSVGIEKYGTTLHENQASFLEWLNHLQEELMDATLYVQRLKNEISENFPEGHVITRESWDSADKITHEGFIYVKFNDLKSK